MKFKLILLCRIKMAPCFRNKYQKLLQVKFGRITSIFAEEYQSMLRLNIENHQSQPQSLQALQYKLSPYHIESWPCQTFQSVLNRCLALSSSLINMLRRQSDVSPFWYFHTPLTKPNTIFPYITRTIGVRIKSITNAGMQAKTRAMLQKITANRSNKKPLSSSFSF